MEDVIEKLKKEIAKKNPKMKKTPTIGYHDVDKIRACVRIDIIEFTTFLCPFGWTLLQIDRNKAGISILILKIF